MFYIVPEIIATTFQFYCEGVNGVYFIKLNDGSYCIPTEVSTLFPEKFTEVATYCGENNLKITTREINNSEFWVDPTLESLI